MEAYYVYMLRCRGGSLYTGMTNDVARRMAMHCSGRGAKYTRAHPPEALAALWRCGDKITASRLEYAIKAKLTHGQKETLAAAPGRIGGVVPRASRRGGNDAARGEGISNFCKSNVSAVTGNDKIGIFSQNALDKPKILAIMKLSAEVPLLLRFNED